MPGATQPARATNRATHKQRLQEGRSRHAQLSRSKLGELQARERDFDPIQFLLNARAGRVADLLPLKHARMAPSPFAFFRGSVAIMAADLARQPNTGLLVQLCGDAHVENLGCFEAPDGRLVFDLNDFDETIRGPWEWDVKRMAASIVLAGLESNHRRSGCATAVEEFAACYCSSIESFADQPILVAARHQIRRMDEAEAVSLAISQAKRADPCELLKKYTEKGSNKQPRFKRVKHVIWPIISRHRQEILASLPLYQQSLPPERLHFFDFFDVVDVCFKVVGTGSVGLRNYVVLMEGNGPGDPLFLQIKQEMPSAYAPYLGNNVVSNEGQRVAEGQRKLQPLSDLLLGWTHIQGHDYLVRQLNDHKGGVDIRNLKGQGLNSLAAIAGELLARGHARSGDAVMIKGYIGDPEKVVKSIVHYALEYAALTESDFEAFKSAIKNEQIKVAA